MALMLHIARRAFFWLKSANCMLLLGLVTLATGLVIYCQSIFYADPTSVFFDYRYAYQERYSLVRSSEAAHFIDTALLCPPRHRNVSTTPPGLCLGLPTIARGSQREQYVRNTIGSLLQGLNNTERDDIHLVVLIAHTDPTTHPVYHEPWLEHLTDRVLIYNDSVDAARISEIRYFEENRLFVNKSVFDYTYMLKYCHRIGAKIVGIVEDDTLACTGWFARARGAIDEIAGIELGADWLYLRMFYTEIYLGWQAEFIVKCSIFNMCVVILFVMSVTVARAYYPKLKSTVTRRAAGLVVVGFILSATLFFSVGRLRLKPLGDGVQRMPRNGCCGQGMLFPREIVPSMIAYLDQQNENFVDSALEIWADQQQLDRWVLVPSLLQHQGVKSSKGVWNDNVANAADPYKIWSFSFENYDSHGPIIDIL